MKISLRAAKYIGNEHWVYIDPEKGLYSTLYEYGWEPIPAEWIEESKIHRILLSSIHDRILNPIQDWIQDTIGGLWRTSQLCFYIRKFFRIKIVPIFHEDGNVRFKHVRY